MKPRNPTEKKRIAYKKDHIYHADSAHGFRKTWPFVKAYSKRAERHKVRGILAESTTADEYTQGDLALEPVRRRPEAKFAPVVPLGESIEWRLQRRGRALGWNLIKMPYSTEAHRVRFVALLESVTQMNDPSARAFAAMIAPILLPDYLTDPRGRPLRTHRHLRTWLQAFFHDEPEWKLRLRGWVESMLSDQ